MRKSSRQYPLNQQYPTPLSSLSVCEQNLIRYRITLLTYAMLAVTLILGALFEEGIFLPSSALASPYEDSDFVQSKVSPALPQTSVLPRVAGTKFIARGKNGGRWRGRVFGAGPTTLILRFFKGDTIVKKKLIGRVHLDSEPQGVRFSYSGTRPRTGMTHWDIIAFGNKSK